MKGKFEKELKVKVNLAMHTEISEIASQAGLYINELIRNAIRNELTRLKKSLRESFLKSEDYKKVRDEAAARGVSIEQVLHEKINAVPYRSTLRQNISR